MMPAKAPHAGACTLQQASDYSLCRGASNMALCQEFQTGMPGAACRQCIESQTTDPSWGAVVLSDADADGATTSVYNTPGCIDDALGQGALEQGNDGGGSCGDLVFALSGCESVACAACLGSSRDMCIGAAAASTCSGYDVPVQSMSGPCGAVLADAPASVKSCFPNPQISNPQQQEVDWISRLVWFMCGS
jgi:hypothetical protein